MHTRSPVYIASILQHSKRSPGSFPRLGTMPSTPLPSLPPSLVPQINLNNTFGAAFIGGFVTAVCVEFTALHYSRLTLSRA